MNLSIQDGRAELWQWDTGVRLVMDEACEAVNLSEDTFGVTVDVTAAEDGKTWVAAVPDEMLQKPGDLICYAVQSTATGTITAAYRSFRVNRRPKPAGYVATPTEARTWQELDDKKIDAPQVAQVGEVLTVDEVDAEGKPIKWKTAPAAAEQKQADWNQNDETAADYVKNRPFYVADEAPLGEVVFTARSVNAITHTVNAMSIKVLTAIFSNTDIHVPRPQIRLFLCGKFYAANVYFDRGNFSFTSDEISGHVNYNTGSEWYLEVQDNSVSFTVGESYSVAFFDINNKGYVKIPLGYFPDSIFTQESAPVRYGDGNLSTIQGSNTTASAKNSHAEGMNTTASGIESHAEGINTTASGDESHAEGSGTKASGNFSHVEGFGTIASGDTQHVQGSYNLSDTTSAHIVGNGTYKQRSNAYTLDWKGNAWFSGNVYVGSTSGTNKDKGSKKLVDTSELSELLGMVQNYAIPNPATAQVGQIVKVKSVDESGKITETETVDMPNRLDVTVSLGDNGFVVSHKFAEIKAAYDAGRAVQLIDTDTFIKYSLMGFFPGSIEGVTYADFRFIDSGGDIWQAEINSNDKLEFFKGSPFVTLYGDVPQNTPKAITYSTSIGIGYSDFIPYIEIPSMGDELKERLVIGPAYFYVMPNAYAPFALKNLVNPYTLTRLSYSEPEFGTENNTFEASYLVTDSLGQQIKATCQVLLTESGLGDLVWNFEVRDSLIVKSSTEGSAKKFKITVDDSGTISATEITD